VPDLDTAELLMNAAMTGRLALTTMLPHDAPGVITRLTEMGVEPFLTASALTAVLAQRLVRRLCLECREEMRPPEEALRRFGVRNAEIGTATCYRAKGCPACRQTGYRGRLALYELLEMDERLRDLTSRRTGAAELRAAAVEAGLVTLMQDGLRKVTQGLTTLQEVMRVLAIG